MFQRYRLAEIAKIKSGKRLPAGCDFSTEVTAHPYIRARDIKNGKLLSNDLAYISDETHRKIQRYIISEGDVAITIVANIGDVGFCDKRLSGANLTENAVRLTDFTNAADGRYLSYYLSQPFMKQYMELLAAGAAQAKLGIYKIEKIAISLPPLPTQRKIAKVLSAYDDLIENNTKRIRILERMAEELYKEWFVRFRFPGHEKAKFVNGLPEGWRKGALKEICEFKRGNNITSAEMIAGDIPVISAGLGLSGFHNRANVSGVSITMSSSGANAGYIAIHYSDIWAADCSYVSSTNTKNIYYAYELLNNLRVTITNYQMGSAQPHVYPRDVNRIKLIVPSLDIVGKANNILAKIHGEIDCYQRQNALLARQRDLLLPRLMSGKLSVEGVVE